ncbi:UNVERIFIED_ORG: hypothetical protein ABIC54_006419 [Burkholderia sp. 1263]
MALKKTVLIAAIGVPASHHIVRRITADLLGSTSAIEVASFYNAEVAEGGAQSIGTATILVDELPAQGDELTAFAERVLSVPMPTDPAYASQAQANRYLFADAEIV